MTQNLMILPTLVCPARCAYCFGPHEGGQLLSIDALEALATWQKSRLKPDEKLQITFHGGEPLLVGRIDNRMKGWPVKEARARAVLQEVWRNQNGLGNDAR